MNTRDQALRQAQCERRWDGVLLTAVRAEPVEALPELVEGH